MALEIERRFLVHGEQWREAIRWQAQLQQGYLVSGPEGFTVRVRTAKIAPKPAEGEPAKEEAWLTLKTAGSANGLVRQEFEYPIPLEDARSLLDLAPSQLSKWRYGLNWPGGDWVLDVFEGSNAPWWWRRWSCRILSSLCRFLPAACSSSPVALPSAMRPWPSTPWPIGRSIDASNCLQATRPGPMPRDGGLRPRGLGMGCVDGAAVEAIAADLAVVHGPIQ